MKIGVLCYYHFPDGMAPTNRILAYTKGLAQNGNGDVQCEIVIFRPRKADDPAPEKGEICEGVSYVYTHTKKPHTSGLINRLVEYPRSVFKTIRYIRRSHKVQPYDVMLISFDNLPFMLVYVPLLAMLGIKLCFIGDEFPEAIRNRGVSHLPFTARLCFKFIYLFIPDRVLMTDTLKDYYDKEIGYKPSYILSSIIDTTRFEIDDHQRTHENYLCYMGAMELSSDNVDLIVRAFSRIQNKNGLELRLYGNPSAKDRAIVSDIIQSCNVSDCVKFMGRVNAIILSEN